MTGIGDLTIQSEVGSITSISNSKNNYIGVTRLNSGNLELGSDSVLDQTSALYLENATNLNLNGKTQAIGQLAAASGSNIDLNQGSLILAKGGQSAGQLSGKGKVTVQSGILYIIGMNTALEANVQIDPTANIVLHNVAGLGLSDININGALTLEQASGNLNNLITGDGQLVLNQGTDIGLIAGSANFGGNILIDITSSLNATAVSQLGKASITNNGKLTVILNAQDEALSSTLTGIGSLIKEGAKRLFLSKSLDHSGETHIKQGSLFVDDGISLGSVNAGAVMIENGADLSGSGIVNGMVKNYGTINVMSDPNTRAFSRTLNPFSGGGIIEFW